MNRVLRYVGLRAGYETACFAGESRFPPAGLAKYRDLIRRTPE